MIHRKLKIGVIGLGVGEQHVIGYQRIPNVEVTDICDIDPSVLKIVGDRNDVPNRHQNYKQITENPNIDVVSIASYDNYHAIQAISAFENGKHVMIEKPLALNRHEAEAILRAQQDSGRFLSSNLVLRKLLFDIFDFSKSKGTPFRNISNALLPFIKNQTLRSVIFSATPVVKFI